MNLIKIWISIIARHKTEFMSVCAILGLAVVWALFSYWITQGLLT